MAAPQVPAPLQSRGGANVADAHVAGPQTVPATYLRQAPVPSQAPSFMQVDAAEAGHWLAASGGCPSAIGEQVPTLPVMLQDMHVPLQVVLQQTPWTQLPEPHSAPMAQVAPFGSLPQLPLASQVLGETQSVLPLQVTLHAPVPHLNGSHIVVTPARQSPAPSQVLAWVSVDPAQAAARQMVPATCCRQAPAPLQVPSLPHDDAGAAGHWVATAGGLPAAIGEQVPTVPVRLQDRQVPEQPTLQQTPCSQWVEVHSEPEVQVAPFGFLSQIVPAQT
jgi:hypothetical protein